MIISACWSAIYLLLPRQIAALFASGNPLYGDCAVHFFRFYRMAFFLYGLHMTTASFFQGIGKPLGSLLIPLVRQGVLLIPLALLLSASYGLNGALFAVPTADSLTCLLCIAMAWAEFRGWKKRGWLEE